jgi:hypothetical protein
MAIDSAAKRRSAVATRRLPWMRRFMPAPDGSMTQEDRQQLAFVYIGILAEEADNGIPSDGWKAEKRPVLWQAEKRSVIWKASNES